MAAVAPAEVPEPLKYQKLALKVSLHCQGCMRKVKKILQSIDGVYKITFDPQQHKVTVTGDVDANTLLKKLEKAGKHAEIWPEIVENKEKKKKKKKKKAKKNDQKSSEEDNTDSAEDDDETPNDNDPPVKSNGAIVTENSGTVTATATGGGGSGGGGGKKKKKKKGKTGQQGNSNPVGVEGSVEVQGAVGSPGTSGPVNPNQPRGDMYPMNMSPPRVYHQYPSPYNVHIPYGVPTYGMSYNTTYPSTSYNASYRDALPEYMYRSSTPSAEVYRPLPMVYTTPVSPTFDVVDTYSDDGNDDDGSGCTIM